MPKRPTWIAWWVLGSPSTERIVRARFAHRAEPRFSPAAMHARQDADKTASKSQGGTLAEPAFCRSWLLLWTGGQTAPIELRQRKSGTTHRRWLPGLSLVSSSTTRLARKRLYPMAGSEGAWLGGSLRWSVHSLHQGRHSRSLPPNNLVR